MLPDAVTSSSGAKLPDEVTSDRGDEIGLAARVIHYSTVGAASLCVLQLHGVTISHGESEFTVLDNVSDRVAQVASKAD
jgi:hypothetical protein